MTFPNNPNLPLFYFSSLFCLKVVLKINMETPVSEIHELNPNPYPYVIRMTWPSGWWRRNLPKKKKKPPKKHANQQFF